MENESVFFKLKSKMKVETCWLGENLLIVIWIR